MGGIGTDPGNGLGKIFFDSQNFRHKYYYYRVKSVQSIAQNDSNIDSYSTIIQTLFQQN